MNKRNAVLALLCVVSAITFLDRLAIAVAEPNIRADLHLAPEQWGWVLSAYVLANALFEIPSGAMGDRRGQRAELTRIAAWWSTFTALTGWCRTAWQMAGARFLFGMGAAGAYPNAAGVISRWFPRREQARAQGFVWGASRLGGALAPLLLVPLERACGWRAIFWVMGVVGAVWSVVWYAWFRNVPQEMRGITDEELDAIELGRAAAEADSGVPWKRLLRLPHLWLITAAYFCYAWGSWFYFGWFSTWLVRGAGFSTTQMGVYASLPFLMGMVGNLLGGVLSERLGQRIGFAKAYNLLCTWALAAGALFVFAMSITRSHVAIVVFATLGFGVMDLMLPSAWAMCTALGGRFGGTATAVMNTAGNLGGWVCTVLFGYLVKATANYNVPLRLIALMIVVAALLFWRVDSGRGLAAQRAEAA